MIDLLHPERRGRLDQIDARIRRLDRKHARLIARNWEARRIARLVNPRLKARLSRSILRRERRCEELFNLSACLHQWWCDVHAGRAL